MLRFLIPLSVVLALLPCRAQTETSGQATPSWIWKTNSPGDSETVFFRREFQLPANIASAAVTVTCDNWNRILVNGEDLGMSDEWQAPRSYDVLSKLKPGAKNVIAVEGRNKGGSAGMALRFRATTRDGMKFHLVSDSSWQCSGESGNGWENLGFDATAWAKPAVVGKMGDGPWGSIMPAEVEDAGVRADMTKDYQVAPGFKLERIYQVPKNQGSWVAVTVDGAGNLLCADQYGKIYQVVISADPSAETSALPLDIPLQGAHGLLWHDGVLWVTVNEGSDQSGVWRVTDTNGDGKPDKPELVKAFQGRGEHGPHALVAAPDGRSIFVIAGNHTDVPEMERSLPSRN
ncbi:MAG: heme-binding protein, partial [Verrucomicrobiaceae bacterium]